LNAVKGLERQKTPVLAGRYVVAFAHADESVRFEQRPNLFVDGVALECVPCLAICQDFETSQFEIHYCNEAWSPLGSQLGSCPPTKRWSALSVRTMELAPSGSVALPSKSKRARCTQRKWRKRVAPFAVVHRISLMRSWRETRCGSATIASTGFLNACTAKPNEARPRTVSLARPLLVESLSPAVAHTCSPRSYIRPCVRVGLRACLPLPMVRSASDESPSADLRR